MALTFPNQSRSFDEARRGVRFTGYDGMFEVPFLIEAAALHENGREASETSCLAAFDAARGSIHDVARQVYGGRRQTIYIISAADLH
jgi:hypothetical protein